MARITREEVARIADLARLVFAADEVERMTGDLETILEYVAQLGAIDTDGADPTSHALPIPTLLRPDRARPGLDPDVLVSLAPEAEGHAFVVPRVIAEDEA